MYVPFCILFYLSLFFVFMQTAYISHISRFLYCIGLQRLTHVYIPPPTGQLLSLSSWFKPQFQLFSLLFQPMISTILLYEIFSTDIAYYSEHDCYIVPHIFLYCHSFYLPFILIIMSCSGLYTIYFDVGCTNLCENDVQKKPNRCLHTLTLLLYIYIFD